MKAENHRNWMFSLPILERKSFFSFLDRKFFFLFVLLLELAVGVCVMCKQQHLRRKHLKSASERGEKCLWMWCCCCIVGECFFPNICRLLWVYGVHKKIIKKISEKKSPGENPKALRNFPKLRKEKSSFRVVWGISSENACRENNEASNQHRLTICGHIFCGKKETTTIVTLSALSLRLFSSGFLVLRQNKISLCFFFSCHEKLLCVGVERAA